MEAGRAPLLTSRRRGTVEVRCATPRCGKLLARLSPGFRIAAGALLLDCGRCKATNRLTGEARIPA